MLTYENKFGQLVLEVVGPYQNVKEIVSARISEDCFFAIETAEAIALITGNLGIQICFAWPVLKRGFVIHHQNSDTAAVCRVVSLKLANDIDARQEIESAARREPRI